LTWALTAIGVILGLLLGWLLRAARTTEGDTPGDWKTRLAARDEDLQAAQQELADTVLQLQELQTTVYRNGNGEPTKELTEARRVLLELGREMEAAELKVAGEDGSDGGLEAARSQIARLEEQVLRLEAEQPELANLESVRCPDPSAHRKRNPNLQVVAPDEGAGAPGDGEPYPPLANGGDPDPNGERDVDDLTSIRGIGGGLSRILTTLGITTYQGLAEIDDSVVGRLQEMLDGAPVDVDPDRWATAARTEHLRKYGVEI
jgi:predicted flap endonuclease-1-like 5' DNA nuclease